MMTTTAMRMNRVMIKSLSLVEKVAFPVDPCSTLIIHYMANVDPQGRHSACQLSEHTVINDLSKETIHHIMEFQGVDSDITDKISEKLMEIP
jgi:hypothetical protein